jgi:hypothetical protein
MSGPAGSAELNQHPFRSGRASFSRKTREFHAGQAHLDSNPRAKPIWQELCLYDLLFLIDESLPDTSENPRQSASGGAI